MEPNGACAWSFGVTSNAFRPPFFAALWSALASKSKRTTDLNPLTQAIIKGVVPWGFDASMFAFLSSNMLTISRRVLAASRALQRRLKADHPEGVPEPVFWSTISMGQTASKDFKTSCMPLWCSELAQQ